MDSYQLCARDTYASCEEVLIVARLVTYLLPFSHSHSVLLEVIEARLRGLGNNVVSQSDPLQGRSVLAYIEASLRIEF